MAKLFLRHLDEIARRCQLSSEFLLLFDFDGTLSPIVKNPHKAVLPQKVKKELIALHQHPKVTLGVVSGRSLEDLKQRVHIPGIIYAANHGFEIDRGAKRLLRKGREFRAPLKQLGREMCEAMREWKGVMVEEKPCSVAIHYRLADPKDREKVIRTMNRISQPWCKRYPFTITHGKMLREVRPHAYWNKGSAVEWIWKKLAPKALPFYIGDDVTDEDAFAVIKKRGIGIRMGQKKKSHASYVCTSIEEFMTTWRGLFSQSL